MLEELKKEWEQYSENSEVWIFQSSTQIADEKPSSVIEASKKFASQWSSHGTALKATAALCYGRFLIFIVNGKEGPSGCSKDSLTHFVQAIGQEQEIDFFNRMLTVYRDADGVIKDSHLNNFGELRKENIITEDTIVFNNLVKNKYELLNNWEVPIKNSWHNQFI